MQKLHEKIDQSENLHLNNKKKKELKLFNNSQDFRVRSNCLYFLNIFLCVQSFCDSSSIAVI